MERFGAPHRRSSRPRRDRKSTRLNSSHMSISYAVFCLKKKTSERHHVSCVQIEAVSVSHVCLTVPVRRRCILWPYALQWRHQRGTRCFFFNDTSTTDIYTLSLHDALPI